MRDVIERLRDPRFQNKHFYLLLLPCRLLSFRRRSRLAAWANANWERHPAFMHRLYWACTR